MTQDVGQQFLCRGERPDYELGDDPLTVADLFCGCGGMTLGLAEAALRASRALDVRLAVDNDEKAIATYKANFRDAEKLHFGRIEELFDGALGEDLTETERKLRDEVGPLSIAVGGPPCQGHSDLNNRTRRRDPRNALYARMARAAEVLRPRAVVVENVQAVVHDEGRVVHTAAEALREADYAVADDDALVDLHRLGVPQRRRRHLLIAVDEAVGVSPVDVRAKLLEVEEEERSVAWAIRDLLDSEGETPFHTKSRASADNEKRMQWLHAKPDRHDLPNSRRPECHQDGDHTYTSVYGKLWWDRPAQTITTGFTSMGQGRFVHPKKERTLTPHEAARLQYFPDFFDWGSPGRTAWSKMIGNAVPPKLMIELGRILIELGAV